MFDTKPISTDAVPAALEKARHYRLLNQSWAAESICLDILQLEPTHQEALITLLLAITDQFADELSAGVERAREVLPRLEAEYKRAYYAGIICERRGKAQLRRGGHGAGPVAYGWFREAMQWYEKAEPLKPPNNDEARLRWNTCARLLNRNPDVKPREEEPFEPTFGE